MTVIAFDTLTDAGGSDLGHSRWIDITQDRIDAFAEVTQDRQWIHVDAERAALGPFGTPIAHGYLTLSLVSAFLAEILVVEGTALTVNYGLDKVRFPAPVPAGSRLRGHGELVGVTPVPSGQQIVVRVTVEAEGQPKPACVADVVIRFLRNREA